MLMALNKLAPSFGKKPVTNEEFELLRSSTITELLKKFDMPFYQVPIILLQTRREVMHDLDKMDLCFGMDKVLRELKSKGYRMGIISSSPQKNIQFILDKFHLDMFEFVHSELNIFGKAGAMEHVFDKYKIDRQKAVYVGDEIRDIEASAKAGIDIISVTWGMNNYEGLTLHGAKYLASTPEELLEAVYDFGYV
jgi:phosphoglycolate phosphatase